MRNSQGFLLIEVLIAFVVIVLGSSVCFYGLSQNLKISKVVKEKEIKMEELEMKVLIASPLGSSQ